MVQSPPSGTNTNSLTSTPFHIETARPQFTPCIAVQAEVLVVENLRLNCDPLPRLRERAAAYLPCVAITSVVVPASCNRGSPGCTGTVSVGVPAAPPRALGFLRVRISNHFARPESIRHMMM